MRASKKIGEKSKLLRFVGGASNSVSANYNEGIMTRLVAQAHGKGFQIYDWTIDSFDASADSLSRILSYGKKSGFLFAALDLNTPEKIQRIRN